MITTLAYVKTKRSKSSEECPHLTRAPGKYKLDHQRGCDVPAKHLLVNCTVTVVKAEILCSSSYSTSQLAGVALTLKLNLTLLVFRKFGL